ncbi:MAG: hypothetical protein L0I76_16230 [Pseudonocardia sp.]|nr:hypothetical protein [Pseudonocardia sp.]
MTDALWLAELAGGLVGAVVATVVVFALVYLAVAGLVMLAVGWWRRRETPR